MGPQERPFAGEVVLVTGGAKRLGRVLGRRLAAVGADVVVHYHSSQAPALSQVEQLKSLGVRAHAVKADLGDPEQAAALPEKARKAMGKPITMLVNSASTFPTSTLAGLTLAELQASVAVNAWGPFELTRSFAQQLPKSSRGAVVNLLDTRITAADWAHMGYHLAKWLLYDLTRLSAIEYAPRVRVNAVAPGAVLPPDEMAKEQAQEVMDKASAASPLRRNPSPDDIADAVLYLLGARTVTGQVLFVDGGRHLVRSMA